MSSNKRQPRLYLGIDTGGTFTDAIILNALDSGVICAHKALTTRHDLKLGLQNAMREVIARLPAGYGSGDIRMVSISTTLATNALVEGEGSRIATICIGYEQSMIDKSGLIQKLRNAAVVSVAGGHDGMGREAAALDEPSIRRFILQVIDKIDAFAVSATFGVRNPAHELRVKQTIATFTDKPVTCGHELTSALDAPRRALTTALNASLIPRIRDLIRAVELCTAEMNIDAPLMVVKGDGTVMAAKVAQERPIETILSGPAASMIGAKALCRHEHFVMADMGGTTTDIGVLIDGRVKVNPHGATVGGTRTMVQAIDLQTFGLGGDSLVDINRDNQIQLGPRRAIPISLLGRAEDIEQRLEALLNYKDVTPFAGWFAVRQRDDDDADLAMDPRQREILDLLRDGPCPLDQVVVGPGYRRHFNQLCRNGALTLAAFTPSDALHVLDQYDAWSRPAARLGAALMLRWRRGYRRPSDAQIENFCAEVKAAVQQRAAYALLQLALHASAPQRPGDPLPSHQTGDPFSTLVSGGIQHAGLVQLRMELGVPIVAVGAPVQAYYPEIGRRLGCDVVMPEHFAVANAVGAVSGLVIQSREVLISRPASGAYRVHLGESPQEFDSWFDALDSAKQASATSARDDAHRAGATAPRVVHSLRKIHLPGTSGDEGIVEAVVKAEAIGRPASLDVRK